MEYDCVTIRDFPDYLISNHGEVLNKNSGHTLRQSETKQGVVKVGIVRGGVQYTRSVKVLVADAFVPRPDDVSDTPILLDGNPWNNRADNIVWRPHWFAWRYRHQFSDVTDLDHIGPLREIHSRDRYVDVYEAAIINGLLFTDIRRSIVTKEPIYPTFQVFEGG
jgi:hypothetical protein